jgi:guanylate kinase
MNKKRLLVLSSPSGGGKSTIATKLMQEFINLKFSVSATTRKMRPGEVDGKQYHFLGVDDFENHIKSGNFVEYEQIFGNYYGTLRSEVNKSLEKGDCLIFDIDVKGAMSIKKSFPEESLLIFISPPNLQVLETRLRNRSTETEEQIKTRLSRAEMEISFAKDFDKIIINDILDDAINETLDEVGKNMEVKRV